MILKTRDRCVRHSSVGVEGDRFFELNILVSSNSEFHK